VKALLAGLIVAGCAIQKPLPAVVDSISCRGAGIEATLRGDASDPRIAWLQDDAGNDISLVWPPGWTARFSP
jgi:hypothetical protein